MRLFFGLQQPQIHKGASAYRDAYMDGVKEYNGHGFASTSKLQVAQPEALELYGLKVSLALILFPKVSIPLFMTNCFCDKSGSSSSSMPTQQVSIEHIPQVRLPVQGGGLRQSTVPSGTSLAQIRIPKLRRMHKSGQGR